MDYCLVCKHRIKESEKTLEVENQYFHFHCVIHEEEREVRNDYGFPIIETVKREV